MNAGKINWFGLAGGIETLLMVALSVILAQPWWQIRIGTEFFKAGLSPINTRVNLFGETLLIPLLWAVNLTSTLFLVTGGATLIIYSFVPTRSYSKHLLSFAYKKPIITLLLFAITLFAVIVGVRAYLGLTIPVNGLTHSKMPTSLTRGAEITLPVATSFTWIFYLGILSAGLCVMARIYHKRLITETSPN